MLSVWSQDGAARGVVLAAARLQRALDRDPCGPSLGDGWGPPYLLLLRAH